MATGRAICAAAMEECGILGQGETPSAADIQNVLQRLNRLCSTLRTQSLVALAVERQLFDLTANQQSYSIGLGAEFNIGRPQRVDGAGLLLNGLSASRAITIARVGTTATVTLASHGVTVGEEVYIAGATDPAYNQTQIVRTTPTSGTFTYEVFGSPVTPAAGSPTLQTYDGVPVEIPRSLLTDDAYEAIQLKTMANAQFTNVYYNPTQPYGTIWLWPNPTTDANQLVLYLQTQFFGFANLNTDYTFPDVAGAEEMLIYNTAKRLALTASFSVPSDKVPGILELARESLSLFKRQNYKLADLPTDPALTTNQQGGYNINTGNY